MKLSGNTPIIRVTSWLGAIMVLAAYGLLTFGYMSASDTSYHVLNLVGSACLALRLFLNSNWANFSLNIVWMGIAVLGLVQIMYMI